MTGEELVNPVQTRQTPFSGRALFFDLHTRQTFSVTPQQYADAQRDFEYCNEQIRKRGKVGTVDFVIETETGKHWSWVYRPDEDYSEYKEDF